MEQNSYYCSKREAEINSKRSEKGCQAEERSATLSVCTKNGAADMQRNEGERSEADEEMVEVSGIELIELIHMGDEVREKRGISREVTLNTALLPKTFSVLKKEPWAGNGCDDEDRFECS